MRRRWRWRAGPRSPSSLFLWRLRLVGAKLAPTSAALYGARLASRDDQAGVAGELESEQGSAGQLQGKTSDAAGQLMLLMTHLGSQEAQTVSLQPQCECRATFGSGSRLCTVWRRPLLVLVLAVVGHFRFILVLVSRVDGFVRRLRNGRQEHGDGQVIQEPAQLCRRPRLARDAGEIEQIV